MGEKDGEEIDSEDEKMGEERRGGDKQIGDTDASFLPPLLFLCFSLLFQCPTLDPSFTDETWSFLSYFCQKSMTFCRHTKTRESDMSFTL